MKAKTILLILTVAVISAAITYTLTGRPLQSAVAGTEPAAPEAGVEIPGLKTEIAVAGEGWDTLSLTGKIAVPSDRLVQVSPRIDGKVVAAYPKVGDTVRKGQTLAMISSVDLAEARAQHRQALARLDAARKSLAQESEAARLGAYSTRPLEEARSAFLEAQGSLADAKSDWRGPRATWSRLRANSLSAGPGSIGRRISMPTNSSRARTWRPRKPSSS